MVGVCHSPLIYHILACDPKTVSKFKLSKSTSLILLEDALSTFILMVLRGAHDFYLFFNFSYNCF
jgi:hypothetical protein